MKKTYVFMLLFSVIAGCSADKISSGEVAMNASSKVLSMRQIDSLSAEQNYSFTKNNMVSAEQNKIIAAAR
jgi:hypothetical protein